MARIHLLRCKFWLTLLVLGLAGSLQAAPAPVAELVGLNGQAEVRKTGAAVFSPARLMQKLWPQEALRTLLNSKAMLLFREQTILVLGPQTTIEISDFLVEPAEPKWRRYLRLVEGRLRFLVSRFTGQDPEMTLETPTLAVAVRGTDGVIDSRPTEDRVYLLAARRPLRLRHKTTGETVDLPENFLAIAKRVGPIEIKPLPPELKKLLLQELSLSFEIKPRVPEANHLDSNKGYAPIKPGEFTKPGVMPVYQPPLPQQPVGGPNY